MGRMSLCAKKMENTIICLPHVTVRMMQRLLGPIVPDHIHILGYFRGVAVRYDFFGVSVYVGLVN